MVTSELRDRITQNLDRLNSEQLKSVVDFVEFLQHQRTQSLAALYGICADDPIGLDDEGISEALDDRDDELIINGLD